MTRLFSLVILLSFFSCRERLDSEIKYFDNYDFATGNYKLLVYGQEGVQIDDYSDFYIDDVQTLQDIKGQWVFKHKSKVMPCGYSYSIGLVDNKSIVKKTQLNIDCEYMSGWIYFPKSYLEDHKGSFKKMTEADKRHFSELYYKK